MNIFSPFLLERLAERLTYVLLAFRQGLANKVAHMQPLTLVFMALWGRVGRAQRRIARFLVQLQAGTLPPVRVRTEEQKARRCDGDAEQTRERGLAHDLAWVREHAIMELNLARGSTEALLAEPEVQALLAAEPRFARMVRGLCRLLDLAVDVPGYVPPKRKTRSTTQVVRVTSLGFREYIDGRVEPPPGLVGAG